MQNQTNGIDPFDFYSDDAALQKAMGKAVYDALRTHKLLGHPIVVWRDGKVVWVPPDEIELPEELNGKQPATLSPVKP
jgi:hypothetical protein